MISGVVNATKFFSLGTNFFTFFAETLVLATKSENWGPSGPKVFSGKSSPE